MSSVSAGAPFQESRTAKVIRPGAANGPPPTVASSSMLCTSPENTTSESLMSFLRGTSMQEQAYAGPTSRVTSRMLIARARKTEPARIRIITFSLALLLGPCNSRTNDRGDRFPSPSAHQLPAVDLDDLAYQVVRRRGDEERDDRGGLFGRPFAAYGDGVLEVLAHLGGREAVVEGGGYDAGGDAVYEDVLLDEFLGHGSCQGAHAALGGGVGDGARPSPVAGCDGGQVDDASRALALHHREDGPGAEKDAFEVYVHHAVPEVLGHLGERAALHEGARVVDEHVEPAVAVPYLPDHPLHLAGVRDVPPDEHRLAARGRDALGDLPRLVLARVVVDDHPASLLGERLRGGAAYAGAAARDPRDLFGKVHTLLPPCNVLAVVWMIRHNGFFLPGRIQRRRGEPRGSPAATRRPRPPEGRTLQSKPRAGPALLADSRLRLGFYRFVLSLRVLWIPWPRCYPPSGRDLAARPAPLRGLASLGTGRREGAFGARPGEAAPDGDPGRRRRHNTGRGGARYLAHGGRGGGDPDPLRRPRPPRGPQPRRRPPLRAPGQTSGPLARPYVSRDGPIPSSKTRRMPESSSPPKPREEPFS